MKSPPTKPDQSKIAPQITERKYAKSRASLLYCILFAARQSWISNDSEIVVGRTICSDLLQTYAGRSRTKALDPDDSDAAERLQASERGKIAAQMGISVDTCLNLLKWMDLCDPFRISDLDVIVAAALTQDAREIHVP